MNQEIYKQLRIILASYDYSTPDGLRSLYKYAKRAGLQQFKFVAFVGHVRNMGVVSKVIKVDGVVKRVLNYYPMTDKYLKEVFPEIETCPNCKGLGVVKIQLGNKKY